MLEITSTRHNPLVDPSVHVWGWEQPVYLFFGGLVAGMMVLAGLSMLRALREERGAGDYNVQTPILGFVLLNVGMTALFIDLAHRWHVWAVYITLKPYSPMSWGSWILLLVFPVLIASALVRLPSAWPWLGRRVPMLGVASDYLLARTSLMQLLAYSNIIVGIGLGIYTGMLLNTMVARPLWNTALLPLLFLVSGLSAAAATMHLLSRLVPAGPAPQTLIGGGIASLLQSLDPMPPERKKSIALARADIAFLAVELTLLALLLLSHFSGSASQIEAARIVTSGPYAFLFWGGVVFAGILVPLVMQLLELGHRIPHTIIPAVLVIAGGFALRWVIVFAGQLSHVLSNPGL